MSCLSEDNFHGIDDRFNLALVPRHRDKNIDDRRSLERYKAPREGKRKKGGKLFLYDLYGKILV